MLVQHMVALDMKDNLDAKGASCDLQTAAMSRLSYGQREQAVGRFNAGHCRCLQI